jgi:hypothetical protein
VVYSCTKDVLLYSKFLNYFVDPEGSIRVFSHKLIAMQVVATAYNINDCTYRIFSLVAYVSIVHLNLFSCASHYDSPHMLLANCIKVC